MKKQHASDSAVATAIAVMAAAITLPFGESVIGVQLDAIAREFDVQGMWLQWVVNAYMLTFATSILAVGILADHLGRRRLFTLGLLVTGVANSLAVFSPSIGYLIALRAASGIGAGTLLATGPALLSARFPLPGPARSRAFAGFGAATGGGIAFGPLVGGLIMNWASWRVVFVVYLPFVLLALALLPRVAASRGHREGSIDGAGIVLFTLALSALIWLLNGGTGYLSVFIIGALIALIFVERWHERPAVDQALFAHPVFFSMSLILVVWQIGVAVSMIYVPALVVAGLALSPGVAGASLVPMAVALFVCAPFGPRLIKRYAVRGFILTCVGLMVVGDAVICVALSWPMPWSLAGLVAGLVCIGMGGGIANGCIDNLALGTVPANRAGAAAGVFQTVRIGAAALAAAAAGAVLKLADSGSVSEKVDASSGLIGRYANMAGGGAILMGLMGWLALWWIKRDKLSSSC